MTKKNRYANRSRISEAKFRQLVKLFCLDLTATQIAAVSGLNINTVDKYLFGIRQRIAEHCEKESPFKGAVEVDESFFGARRVKGKRGRGYNGLVDVGYGKHLRVNHGNDEFVRGQVHINGIEGFWGLAKTRLTKFKGMHPTTFYYHLKECEFRYNYRDKNMYKLVLKIIRNHPLCWG